LLDTGLTLSTDELVLGIAGGVTAKCGEASWGRVGEEERIMS